MLKKRLRDYLEETVRLCDMSRRVSPHVDLYERLTDTMQLVRILRVEGNYDLTHNYTLKAIKMAEEGGYLEIWLECLRMELLYYNHMGHLPKMAIAEQKIQALIKDIALANQIMAFLLREQMRVKQQASYDTTTWTEQTLSIRKEVDQFVTDSVANHNVHIQLAVITAQLFATVRIEDPAWRTFAQAGYEIVKDKQTVNPTFALFIYLYQGVSRLIARDYDALEMLYHKIKPMCLRFPTFHISFYTVLISARLQQRQYDEAYRQLISAQSIKIPAAQQNQELEIRLDYVRLIFYFLYKCGKLKPTGEDLTTFVKASKKDNSIWLQDLRIYRVVTTYVCLIEIASGTLSSARRTASRVRTHIEAYPMGGHSKRLGLFLSAIEVFLKYPRDRDRVKVETEALIAELNDSNDIRSSDEFFPYEELWSLISELSL